MQLQDYVDEVLLKLGNGIVKVELEDNAIIENVVKAAFREIQRYINVTKYSTIPYAKVIDLSNCNVNAVVQVMRSKSATAAYDLTDAMYLSISSFPAGINGMSDYRSFLRTRQIKNQLTQDLNYIWDETTKRLYINASYPAPSAVTIAYIPIYNDIEEINSPYWEDMLVRLSLALSKETLGRIRGKYRLNNALYDLDSEALLTEASQELSALREHLQSNSDLVLPID